jgi:hypothetical protein
MSENLNLQNIRYDRNNRQIQINSPGNVPVRDFLQHLKQQGLDTKEVLNVFPAGDVQGGTSRSNTEGGAGRKNT